MEHTTTYKFKSYPTKEQEAFLEQQMYGLRRIYNAMIEYVYNDKILFREDVEKWIEKRMYDCYGTQKDPKNKENRNKYLEKLNKKIWFKIDSAKLTNVATKVSKNISNFDGSIFDTSFVNSSAIGSMVKNDLSRALEKIRKDDNIYLENGQWLVEKFSKKENKLIKFPLKSIKGYPKWKKKEERNSYYEDCSGRDNVKIEDKSGTIDLAKLKTPIKFFVYRDMIPGKILQKKTILKDIDGSWWICLQVTFQKESVAYPITKETTVGIDLGMKTHGVCSNGQTLENDAEYQRLCLRKAKLHRIFSRKDKEKKKTDKIVGTKSLKSNKLKLAQNNLNKIELKIKRRRKYLIDNFTKTIVSNDNVNTIVLENLSSKDMIKNNIDRNLKYRNKRKRKFNKSLHNSAMYMIRSNITYKSKFLEKNLIIAKSEFPSTQLCSCGAKTGPKGEYGLNIREWKCSSCGKLNSRDFNSSENLVMLPFEYKQFVDFAESGINAIRDFGSRPEKIVKSLTARSTETPIG